MGKEIDFLGLQANKDKLQSLGRHRNKCLQYWKKHRDFVLLFLFLRFGSINRGIFQNLGGRERF